MFNLKIQISDFLSYCNDRKVLNKKTIRAYSIDLRQFVQFTKNSYNKDIICSYISFLHNTYKSKTAKRKIVKCSPFVRQYGIIEIYQKKSLMEGEFSCPKVNQTKDIHRNLRSK